MDFALLFGDAISLPSNVKLNPHVVARSDRHGAADKSIIRQTLQLIYRGIYVTSSIGIYVPKRFTLAGPIGGASV